MSKKRSSAKQRNKNLKIQLKLRYLIIGSSLYFHAFVILPILLSIFMFKYLTPNISLQYSIILLLGLTFRLLVEIPLNKIRKNNWNKDYWFSIVFYFISQLPLIVSIIFYTCFYENIISTISLMTTLSMLVFSNFAFFKFYIDNKTLTVAILKWQNVYPIMQKLIKESNVIKNEGLKK